MAVQQGFRIDRKKPSKALRNGNPEPSRQPIRHPWLAHRPFDSVKRAQAMSPHRLRTYYHALQNPSSDGITATQNLALAGPQWRPRMRWISRSPHYLYYRHNLRTRRIQSTVLYLVQVAASTPRASGAFCPHRCQLSGSLAAHSFRRHQGHACIIGMIGSANFREYIPTSSLATALG